MVSLNGASTVAPKISWNGWGAPVEIRWPGYTVPTTAASVSRLSSTMPRNNRPVARPVAPTAASALPRRSLDATAATTATSTTAVTRMIDQGWYPIGARASISAETAPHPTDTRVLDWTAARTASRRAAAPAIANPRIHTGAIDHHAVAGANAISAVARYPTRRLPVIWEKNDGVARTRSSNGSHQRAASSIASGSHGPSRSRAPSNSTTETRGPDGRMAMNCCSAASGLRSSVLPVAITPRITGVTESHSSDLMDRASPIIVPDGSAGSSRSLLMPMDDCVMPASTTTR